MKKVLDAVRIAEDKEADIFARYLLVPSEFLKAEIKRRGFQNHIGDDELKILARHFQVEMPIVVARLIDD
ncbi:ImmA/IrrE family metallo-endopeptidase, partial [Lacticaseibacillus paracasei]